MPRYLKNPITEAACTIGFQPREPWDAAVPGLLFEKLRAQYPIRKSARNVNATFTAHDETVTPRISHVDRFQMWNEDMKETVQVLPNLISINRLPPYENWASFVPSIERAINTYVDVNPPISIQSLALQYTNIINIPGRGFDLNDWFMFGVRPPNIKEGDVILVDSLSATMQRGYEDNQGTLKIETMSLDNSHDTINSYFLLRIAFELAETNTLDIGGVIAWLTNTAHVRIGDAFEGCITDQLRTHFQPEG